MKEVSNRNLWKFKLSSQQSMNVPIWITIGFQQRNRQDPQDLNHDTFSRLPATSAQCISGTENYPVAAISFIYDNDESSHGYG